jgi:hypothetical protein
VLTTLFRYAVCLYPAEHRRIFEAEMTSVHEQGLADARMNGAGGRIWFGIREVFGVLGDVVRCRWTREPSGEAWIRSLEAPGLALTFYALGLVSAHELGLWGFFFPSSYGLLVGMIAGTAWMIGRTCTMFRTRRRAMPLSLALAMSVVIIPGMLRVLEDTRLAAVLAQRQAAISFSLPGIEVRSFSGAVDAPHRTGLTFSRVVTDGRTAMTFVHHRQPLAPPYEALGAVVTGAIAFASRRRLSW